ncbi:WG repeat-containing protein [Segatella copri]|uniref:WG repeat-containing protein n=1 Tax=Segatella copri TaxID=165179 RepID=UPI003F8AEC00
MRRTLYIIILTLLPIISYAQSIADLTKKAEIEKNPLHIYSSIGFYHNDLYIVRKDNDKEGTYAYGVVDNDGTVYIPVEYDQIEFEKEGREYKDNIYKCKKKEKWGLVSSTNGILLPCEYSSLEGNGIWRTCKSGKYGYVQLNGTSSITTLIPCIYESLGKYSADSYIRATLKGKKGMIDSQNKIIIPFKYSKVGNPCHTSNGYSIIWVEKDGKLGIYNDDGKELQPCDIDKAYILTENNSIELSYTDCPSTDYIYIVRNGLTGLISGSTFETIIPCMYEYLSPIKTSKAFYKANGKWGIIDANNKTIQLAIYDNVEIDGSTLSEQKMPSMAFQSNMYVRNNGKVGMLKANGEDFIPVKYDSLGMYSDNMLVAKVGDKYGFLNEEGKESVPFVYSQAHNYSEGLAAVVNENGKYLFIDKSGNVTIKPKEYDRVDNFQNGTCKVYRKDKVWEIDREGKKVKDSTKKLEADDTHEGSGNDDMYVENTNYSNGIDTNNTLTPNITPTLNFNDKFFQHQQIKTDNVIPNNKNKDETELKYDEISDLKRQKLNGRIKKIGCSSYNEKDDPNGLGHGLDSYEFEYDNNGMLTKYSYEAPYVGDITFHYNNGKLISSSGYLGGSSFLYQKKDKTTVDIIERDKDGGKRIVMTLNFYPNGVIKQKRILSSLVDPYNKEVVIRYDTNGIEIDDMPSYGEIISEKRDTHNNWTKRIFRDGREVIRDIEYY